MLNRRTTTLLVVLALSCAAPPPPQLKPPAVGVVTGEVFVEDPARVSVDGAFVELAGTSTRVLTQAGRQFVLTAVPVGDNLITITHPPSGRVRRITVKVEQANQTIALPAEQTTLQAAARVTGSVSVPSGSVAGAIAYLVGGSGRQAAIVGDDGSFVLEGLPPGVAKIGVQLIGFTSVVKALTLAEGDNDGGTFALTPPPTTAGTLTLASAVKLADRTDHSGIAVLLNGGEKVATTDAEGAYAFTGLSPGLVTLRAVLSGYRSVELPPVSLNADGSAEGLVPALLTPGSDSENTGTDPNRTFTVRITSPASGTAVELGSEVTFHAETVIDGEVIPPARVKWTTEGVEPVTASRNLGTGTIVSTSTLPLGLHLVRATATAADGESKSSEILLEVRPITLSVEITSLADNAQVVAGIPLVLSARVEVRADVAVAAGDVVWSVKPFGSTAPDTVLGTGARLVAALPPVAERTLYDISVDVSVRGGAARARETVGVVALPFRPLAQLQPLYADIGLTLPGGTVVTDSNGLPVRTDYAISQGQPVVLRADLTELGGEAFSGTVRWQSDTGILFTGVEADLSVLPLGTHDFTLAVSTDDGVAAQSVVRVVVTAFTFTATVRAPVLQPATPYYADFGLPLEGSVSHPYQPAFPLSAIRWLDASGRQLSNGLVTRAPTLAAGPGTVTLEVTDALGHVARASSDFVLQAVTFTSSVTQPPEGTDVLEGTAVTFRASAAHSLVPSVIPASALKVRFLSSVQGLLSDASGRSEFAADEACVVSNLVPATHVVTARFSDGRATADAQRTVRVRGPGLNATLQSPSTGLVLFDGTALRLVAAVSADQAVTPLVSWFLDGVEFASSWAGYGTDATAAARRTLDFGAYAAAAAPFSDPRWAPGNHRIELRARLASVDPGLGCVNLPGRAACAAIDLSVAPASPDIVTHTIGVGTTEVWDGVRRLRGVVTVDGGTLIVNPGARVIVEDLGNVTARFIQVRRGVVRIGSKEATARVLFEAANTKAAGRWDGVRIEPNNAANDTQVTVERTTFRHTRHAFVGGSNRSGENHRLELRDVEVDTADGVMWDTCPEVAEDVTVKNVIQGSYWAWHEGAGNNCPADRVLRRVRFEKVQYAYAPRRVAGRIDLAQVAFVNVRTPVDAIDGQDWTFTDCFFDGPTNERRALSIDPPANLRVVRSVFRGGTSGLRLANTANRRFTKPQLAVVGSVFVDNGEAIYSETRDSRELVVRGSTFDGNAENIELNTTCCSYTATDASDADLRGNWLGAAGVATTTGGALAALPPGTFANLPAVTDFMDLNTRVRVARVDNPLQAKPAPAVDLDDLADGLVALPSPLVVNVPSAVVVEPRQTATYRSEECVPLLADVLQGEVDVAEDCRWYARELGTTQLRAEVFRDEDGCLDGTRFQLKPADYALQLECSLPEGGRLDVHEVRFRVDEAVRRADVFRPVETWSGRVVLDGDVVVPAGRTLRILPGTQVVVRTGDRRRHARSPVLLDSAANLNFGARSRTDLYVAGTLEAVGTLAAPIRFEAETGAELSGQWGGIFVEREATATLEHVVVLGADTAVAIAHAGGDATESPEVRLRNVEVVAANHAVRGTCPQQFDDVTARKVDDVLFEGQCLGSLTINRGRFLQLRVTGENPVISVRPHETAPVAIALSVLDSEFTREAGLRQGWALRTVTRSSPNASVGLVRVARTTFDSMYGLLEWGVQSSLDEALEVDRVRMRNFDHLVRSGSGQAELMSVTNSAFETGEDAFSGWARTLAVTGNRFKNVQAIVADWNGSAPGNLPVAGGSIQSVTFTGNHVEGARRVFGFVMSSGSNQTPAFDLRGNNFVGTTEKVLFLATNNLTGGNTLTCDVSGAHWGVAAEADVRNLITDPQADQAAGYKGRTKYLGFSTTPLTLTLPEP